MIVMLSLDYSVCFYIYTLSALSILRFPKCREKYGLFFLFIGMLTAYMDLLTWPLVTWAVPLMILVQYRMSVSEKLKRIMIASGAWSVGYIVQWSSKWLAATLILDDNVFADAIESLLFRSALSEKDAVTWGDVVMKNLFVFQKAPCLLLGGAGALLTVIFIYRNKGKIQWCNMIPSLLIAAAPFLWYLVTRNHAYEHYWMTWRNLSISVFALYGGLAGSVLRENQ